MIFLFQDKDHYYLQSYHFIIQTSWYVQDKHHIFFRNNCRVLYLFMKLFLHDDILMESLCVKWLQGLLHLMKFPNNQYTTNYNQFSYISKNNIFEIIFQSYLTSYGKIIFVFSIILFCCNGIVVISFLDKHFLRYRKLYRYLLLHLIQIHFIYHNKKQIYAYL